MKKLPLYYNEQVVGYVDEITYNEDSVIDLVKIYLFYNEYHDLIIEQIKGSSFSTFDKNIDTKNIHSNNLYDFYLDDYDFLVCKLK